MTMKYSSGNGQPVSKIKGFRQFMTSIPRHVSENQGYIVKGAKMRHVFKATKIGWNEEKEAVIIGLRVK